MHKKIKKGLKHFLTVSTTYPPFNLVYRIGHRPFFKDFHIARFEKGIKVKMLANFETRGNIEPETLPLADIRYLPENFHTNMHIFFYNDKVILIIWMKEPIAFFIRSKDAVKSFKTYFDTFWNLSKK